LYIENLKNVIRDFKNYKPDDTVFTILGCNALKYDISEEIKLLIKSG
jgi:hypothetical protein